MVRPGRMGPAHVQYHQCVRLLPRVAYVGVSPLGGPSSGLQADARSRGLPEEATVAAYGPALRAPPDPDVRLEKASVRQTSPGAGELGAKINS